MAAKPLPSQEVLNQLLRYEPETGKLFWKERGPEWFKEGTLSNSIVAWNAVSSGREAFTTIDTKGYRVGGLFGRRCRAHRIIWKLVYGEDAEVIDHQNGDGSDNRLCNIVSGTKRANTRNRKRPSNNTSGVVGVSWDRFKKKWVSFIRDNTGKHLVLTVSDSFSECLTSRKAAEEQYGYHGNHGRDSTIA